MAWSLHEGHLPAEALVEVALGQPLSRARREVIESHLALCSQCAEELALLREDPEKARRATAAGSAGSAGAAPWWLRAAAVAATLVAVLCAAGWWSTARQLAQEHAALIAPRLNTPILELMPTNPGTVARGATSDPSGLVNDWDAGSLPGEAEEVVLTLLSGELKCPEGCTVELLNGQGAPIWTSQGLRATPAGHATLTLPRDLLPDGTWTVLLSENDHPDEVVRYRIESP